MRPRAQTMTHDLLDEHIVVTGAPLRVCRLEAFLSLGARVTSRAWSASFRQLRARLHSACDRARHRYPQSNRRRAVLDRCRPLGLDPPVRGFHAAPRPRPRWRLPSHMSLTRQLLLPTRGVRAIRRRTGAAGGWSRRGAAGGAAVAKMSAYIASSPRSLATDILAEELRAETSWSTRCSPPSSTRR